MMPNPNLTEISIVMDKSGSMEPRRQDAIRGFNSFIEEQRHLAGDARVTLTLFDTTYRTLYAGKRVSKVPSLDTTTYQPGGMTALLDAVGRTIDQVGERLARMPERERPGKVIVAILTDGLENSSQEYSYDQVAARIRHQTDIYDWDFIFLGAGPQAWDQGAQLNITANFSLGAVGASQPRQQYNTLAAYTRARRAGGTREQAIQNARETAGHDAWRDES
ncbi:MAG: vWA domain-containing protein [Ardenticatenaceae bacterium]